MGMCLTSWAKKPESRSSTTTSTALVVIELPADGMLVEEPDAENLQGALRRRAGLLARSGRAARRVARRLIPAGATKTALGTSGRAAKSVVVKLDPRRLAGAAREFRRIGAVDLSRLARGVDRGSKGVASRFRFISPRKAHSVRVVAAAVRKLVQNIDPGTATCMAREATRLAQKSVVKLDPRRVEEAVRRVAGAVDSKDHGKRGESSGGGLTYRVAKTAIAKIGPTRAVQVAGEATRAFILLVDRVDADHTGKVIGDLVAAAKSANDRKGRLRVVGFLASLASEGGRALENVAKNIEARDVAVVALVVLTTAPQLLIAAGVSVAALRVLTQLTLVFVTVLPDRRGNPT